MAARVEIIGCLIVVAVLLQGAAAADTHHVGGNISWSIPTEGESAYTTWASGEDFKLGDTIVFNWTGTHTVARVSKDVYDNCTTANVLDNDIQATSPVNYTLNSTEPQYFICTIGRHCSLGQKVTISISSATSLTVGAVTTMLLVMAISFLTSI
ncbi:umecyanin [Vitis vinifera]|uniref:Umecyanin n=2 Tax=Vitis vinifera TaxID=29760 RepID=A0A438C0F2_VITVI|eukprot:XP_002285305.1 PREDICTED: umecyanin [Vitis vinifera]